MASTASSGTASKWDAAKAAAPPGSKPATRRITSAQILTWVLLAWAATTAILYESGAVNVAVKVNYGVLQTWMGDIGLGMVTAPYFNSEMSSAAASPPAAATAGTGAHVAGADCIVADGRTQFCAADQNMWAESLTHPSILLHPAARRVLVLGPLGAPLVAQSLRHFLVREIVWVPDNVADTGRPQTAEARAHAHRNEAIARAHFGVTTDTKYSTLQEVYSQGLNNASVFRLGEKDEDILARTTLVHRAAAEYVRDSVASEAALFDVVLVDYMAYSKELLGELSKLVANGGILGTASSIDSLLSNLPELASNFKNINVATQFLPSMSSDFAFYTATSSDLHFSWTAVQAHYVDQLISRRITDGASSLMHYDGETHRGMFSLRKALRQTVLNITKSAATRAAFPTSYAPSAFAAGMVPDAVAGQTMFREFFDCRDANLEDVDALVDAVRDGLRNTHTKVRRLTVANERDMRRLVDGDNDDDDDDDSDDSNSSSSGSGANVSSDADDDAAQPRGALASTVISAILLDGQFTMRVYKAQRYASAEYTSYGFAHLTMSDELMDSLGSQLGAKRTVGATHARGTIAAAGARDPAIDLWFHDSDYYQSDKIEVRASATAGRGQHAGAAIKKGEVLFQGPIESYLRHESEMAAMPGWRARYIDHMGEQAEDDIWVAPQASDDDASYYTNHHCDPNLVYDGYDTMLARRDIAEGDELTFEYITADSEPREVFKCNCGAPAGTCRGTIHGNDWTSAEMVERLGIGAFWPHIQRKIILHRAGRRVETLDPNSEKSKARKHYFRSKATKAK